jgi:hypothetical protein
MAATTGPAVSRHSGAVQQSKLGGIRLLAPEFQLDSVTLVTNRTQKFGDRHRFKSNYLFRSIKCSCFARGGEGLLEFIGH